MNTILKQNSASTTQVEKLLASDDLVDQALVLIAVAGVDHTAAAKALARIIESGVSSEDPGKRFNSMLAIAALTESHTPTVAQLAPAAEREILELLRSRAMPDAIREALRRFASRPGLGRFNEMLLNQFESMYRQTEDRDNYVILKRSAAETTSEVVSMLAHYLCDLYGGGGFAAAMHLVREFGTPVPAQGIEVLVGVIKDRMGGFLDRAISAVKLGRAPLARPQLLELLENGDREQKILAVVALWRSEDNCPEDVLRLVQRYIDNPDVIGPLAYLVGGMGSNAVFDQVCAALRNYEVMLADAKKMMFLGNSEYFPDKLVGDYVAQSTVPWDRV